MTKLNVLSLFDGMSCGRVALDRAGIDVYDYYASEIDKYASAVSRVRYPDIKHLGDVKNWKDWDIDWSSIDLLIGGSPCFRAGTLITTDKGYKDIKDIVKGDMVLTHKNRFRKVVLPMVTKSDKIYEVNIQGNIKTHVTEEHPYYVRKMFNNQLSKPDWVKVKDLSDGDFVGMPELSDDLTSVSDVVWAKYLSKTLLDITDTVYNFEVEEDNSYVANNCIVHNCQGFSFAGKQLNFNDPRSKLFFEYVDILNHIKEVNPKVLFLLENVKMKSEFRDIISGYLHIEPIEIDSALVSAQRRKRLYWTNIEGVEQPEDKGILLKDIVHEHADMDNAVSDSWLKWFGKRSEMLTYKSFVAINPEKAVTMTARPFASWRGNFIFECLADYIVDFDDTLKILDTEVKKGKIGYFNSDSQGNRIYQIHDKSITLTSNAGGKAGKTGMYLFGCLTPNRINKRQNGQRFNDGNKFYTLTTQDNHGILTEGYIRKLTPIECERLQTLPDDYTLAYIKDKPISDCQRYKMLGNGWTVDVIAHILKNIKR